MAYRPLITVAGVELPDPGTYEGLTATFVDSGRNALGFVIGAVIRDDVGKIDATWRYLTVKQWADINTLFKMSAGGRFYNRVTFLDQTTGEYATRTMYVSDRTAGAFKRDRRTNELMGWTECRLALTEV